MNQKQTKQFDKRHSFQTKPEQTNPNKKNHKPTISSAPPQTQKSGAIHSKQTIPAHSFLIQPKHFNILRSNVGELRGEVKLTLSIRSSIEARLFDGRPLTVAVFF
ncbi:MAG: hypothetical protein IJC63_03225 [Myxococcaceae bacterium]|nr:hypothetical protein [Myxococcaceae bacterium]